MEALARVQGFASHDRFNPDAGVFETKYITRVFSLGCIPQTPVLIPFHYPCLTFYTYRCRNVQLILPSGWVQTNETQIFLICGVLVVFLRRIRFSFKSGKKKSFLIGGCEN